MTEKEDLKEGIDEAYKALLIPSTVLISALMVLSTNTSLMKPISPSWILGLHLPLTVFSALFWCTGAFEKEEETSLRYRRRGLNILLFSLELAPLWIIVVMRAEYPYAPIEILTFVGLAYLFSAEWVRRKMCRSLKQRYSLNDRR